MCTFHVLMVRRLPDSEGASALCMGLPGNSEAPLATYLWSTHQPKFPAIYTVLFYALKHINNKILIVFILPSSGAFSLATVNSMAGLPEYGVP